MKKLPFDLSTVLKKIEIAVAGYPKAAMFELYDRGYRSLFEQLVSCVISIRTMDETTIPVSERLFEVARTPESMMSLPPSRLLKLLYGSTFPGQKVDTILGISKAAAEQYNGKLPEDFDQLTALKGVGPKCANLALGVAAGKAAVSVDVHVHRVVNRWGYIQTTQPVYTMKELEEKVPQKNWTDINRLLMPFGKHICTASLPHCSTCSVLAYCRQVGVVKYR